MKSAIKQRNNLIAYLFLEIESTLLVVYELNDETDNIDTAF